MKAKQRTFRWACGAYFVARLVPGERTAMEYKQVFASGADRGLSWRRVDVGRAVAFAYGAKIRLPNGNYWSPRGDRTILDMYLPITVQWRRTTMRVLKHLGVIA